MAPIATQAIGRDTIGSAAPVVNWAEFNIWCILLLMGGQSWQWCPVTS